MQSLRGEEEEKNTSINAREHLALTQPDVQYFDFFTNLLGDASNSQREPEVDWCRVVANWLVVIVHYVVAVKEMDLPMEEPQRHSMESFLVNLLQIGMPFLFAVTGRASAYVSETNYFRFTLIKCMRLLIPLAAAYLLIVIPAAFASGPFWTCRRDDMPPTDLPHFFSFYFWYLRTRTCGVEWLWFLPILLTVSVATFPQVLWIITYHLLSTPDTLLRPSDIDRRNAMIEKRQYNPHKTFWFCPAMMRAHYTLIGGIVYIGFLSILAGRLLWGLDWLPIALFTLPCMFFPLVVALILPLCRRINCREPLLFFLPLATLVMAAIKPSTNHRMVMLGCSRPVARFVTSTPFNCAFFLQGVLEQRLMFEWEARQRHVFSIGGQLSWYMILRPLKLLVWVALIANGMPGYYPKWGYLWSYPLYDDAYLAVCYVLGSWIYFHLLERFGMMYLRSVIHPKIFKHVAQSSMFVYLFHGLSIGIVGRLVIWPFHETLNAFWGVLIFVMLATPITILAYFIVLRIPPLAILFGMRPDAAPRKNGGGEETIEFARHV